MGVGTVIMGSKDADNKLKVKDAVEELTDKFGKDPSWVDPDDSGPKKKKRHSTAKQVRVGLRLRCVDFTACFGTPIVKF